MMRLTDGSLILLLGGSMLLAGCDKDTASPQTPEPVAAAPAEPATEPAEPTQEEPATLAEDEAKKAEEEAKARMAKAYQEIEDWKAAEAERWNDDVEAKAKKLSETKFKKLDPALKTVLASPHRHPDNVKRDSWRHPKETLKFFGLKPDMTVVEVGPGAGWYTEILAPVLAQRGKLVITDYDPNGPETERTTFYAKRMQAFLERSDALYGKIERVVQQAGQPADFGEPGSADMVLIIRGLHGRVNAGNLDAYLKEANEVLKPGGVLGVVQHRAKADADPKEASKKGYLPEEWLIAEVEKAGFKLDKKAEINANPKDTKDHPQGVWSLLPTVSGGDEDRAKYEGIGESDRMTLKFVKKK